MLLLTFFMTPGCGYQDLLSFQLNHLYSRFLILLLFHNYKVAVY